MPENTITKIISGVIGLGLLIAVVYLIAVDRSEHVDMTIAVGFAILGAVNAALPSAFPKSKGPKLPPLPILMALALLVAGCGAGARGVQADTVAAAAIVWSRADQAIVAVRAQHLDAIVEEAEAECVPTGCSEERAAHYRERLAAEEARWAPLMECRDPVPESLSTWLDSVDVTGTAPNNGVEAFTRLGGRFVVTYGELAECVNGAVPPDTDVELPELPPELDAIARAFDGARTAGGEAGAQ